MPSRVIRGEINTSDSLSRVSMEADLTFRALLVAVDDYGRFDGRLVVLKSALFPLREIELEDLRGWLSELEAEGCVTFYQVRGRPYLHLPAWEKHRGKGRRAGASRYPSWEEKDTAQDDEMLPRNPRISAHGSSSEGRGTSSVGRVARDVGRVEEQAPTELDPSARDRGKSPTSQEPPWKPLLNLLSKEPGSPEEKARWLEHEWPLLEAEADKTAPKDAKARGAAIRSLAIRYYRFQKVRSPAAKSPQGNASRSVWRPPCSHCGHEAKFHSPACRSTDASGQRCGCPGIMEARA